MLSALENIRYDKERQQEIYRAIIDNPSDWNNKLNLLLNSTPLFKEQIFHFLESHKQYAEGVQIEDLFGGLVSHFLRTTSGGKCPLKEFDPNQGQFSSYAFKIILRELPRILSREGPCLAIPVLKLYKKREIVYLSSALKEPDSSLYGDSTDYQLADRSFLHHMENSQFEVLDIMEHIKHFLKHQKDPKDLAIVNSIYGLNGEKRENCRDIGKRFGISGASISFRERNLRKKLKRHLSFLKVDKTLLSTFEKEEDDKPYQLQR